MSNERTLQGVSRYAVVFRRGLVLRIAGLAGLAAACSSAKDAAQGSPSAGDSARVAAATVPTADTTKKADATKTADTTKRDTARAAPPTSIAETKPTIKPATARTRSSSQTASRAAAGTVASGAASTTGGAVSATPARRTTAARSPSSSDSAARPATGRTRSVPRTDSTTTGAVAAAATAAAGAPTPVSSRDSVDHLLASPAAYQGWKTFHVYCYRCHGVDAMGSNLAPNLRHSVGPEGTVTHEVFVTTVKEGRLPKGMPSWKVLLTDDQIENVWAYLKARSSGQLAPGRPHQAGTQ